MSDDEACVSGHDILPYGEDEADNDTAVEAAEARLAMALRQAAPPSPLPELVMWRRPLRRGPRPKKYAVHCNKCTSLVCSMLFQREHAGNFSPST